MKQKLERRCPRLGGPVPFAYCKANGEDLKPCFKIVDCWWEIFDVVRYLKDTLSAEEFSSIVAKKPKPKITSILDIVEKTQKRSAEPES